MIDLAEELSQIAQVLEAAAVPFALVGGLAYSLYVEPRATIDIDLLIDEAEWPRIPGLLEPLGYLALAGPMDFPNIRIRRLTKIAGADFLVVDFLLADDYSRYALVSPNKLPFRQSTIPVVPIPVLIKLKLGRNSPRDQADIAELRRKYGKGADGDTER